jgi:hypothetical protein
MPPHPLQRIPCQRDGGGIQGEGPRSCGINPALQPAYPAGADWPIGITIGNLSSYS